MPRALWVWPGESLSLVCRSAGSCLLCSHPVGPAGCGHELGSGWAGSEMGLASGGGVRRGGTAPTGRGRRVWARGSGGDIYLGTRPAGAVLLGVAEWSLGIWRAEVKCQPIPRPLGSEDKGSWWQADVEADWLCHHSVNQLLFPVLFLPVLGNTPRLPYSSLAQARFISPVVAAGLTVEWLWPVGVSRRDRRLGRCVSVICRGKNDPGSHGSHMRGTERADSTRAGNRRPLPQTPCRPESQKKERSS